MKNRYVLLTIAAAIVLLTLASCSHPMSSKAELEKTARELLDRDIEAFTEIFYLKTLPVDTEDGSYDMNGTYPVKSDKFKAYADLEHFVRSTYVKKEADYLLTNFNDNGPQYINKDGKLYVDKSKEGGIGYYKDWENYKLNLQDIKKDSVVLTVTVKEADIGSDPLVENDKEITVKMVKENNVWLLEKMVY